MLKALTKKVKKTTNEEIDEFKFGDMNEEKIARPSVSSNFKDIILFKLKIL
jgi:hypothetical protein